MHVRDIRATVPGVKAGGFMRRRKRLAIAVVVAALLSGPLTTGVEVFALNLVGLGIGAAAQAVPGAEVP